MAWNDVPAATFRTDGYVNVLNRYGTTQDNSTSWEFRGDGMIPDMQLTEQYENNGLFAKIIDIPAEESIKHGFDLGLTDDEVATYITDTLDWLDWEEKAATAIKWARLYGGALGVMLIDDGRGIDEPVNWQRIRSLEEIRVYDRACVWPDYSVLYDFNNIPKPKGRGKAAATRHGMPEFYYVNSIFGQFWVHESRCLVFRNGILPERTLQPNYRFWGTPEYIRIRRELREAATSHSTSVKMLERSVQAIYKMKGLAKLIARDFGEEDLVKRLQVIDMARSFLNSVAIDAEGEEYNFEEFSMAGVKDVIESTCGMLSAVTYIPQTVLWGCSPAGMNATGKSDLEIWYNYVERIQKLNLSRNLQTVLDIIIRAAMNTGKLSEEPDYKLKFNSMWSMTAEEEARAAQIKTSTQQAKMQTAKGYFEMGVLDPSEIRKGLAQEGDFCIEELLENIGASEDIPDMWQGKEPEDTPDGNAPNLDGSHGSVGVLVINDDGRVLAGTRTDDGTLGGPGGHIEAGESPRKAAVRETVEEFGIIPTSLTYLGQLDTHDKPHVFLCTDFIGKPECNDGEMSKPQWIDPHGDEGFTKISGSAVGGTSDTSGFFPPYAASLSLIPTDIQNPLTYSREQDKLNTVEPRADANEQSREPAGNSKGGQFASSNSGAIKTPSETITQVYDPGSGERVTVVPGKPVTNKASIAGKDDVRGRVIGIESLLVDKYGGTKGEWQKRTQFMTLERNGKQQVAEVHFYHERTVGYVEQKVKHWR